MQLTPPPVSTGVQCSSRPPRALPEAKERRGSTLKAECNPPGTHVQLSSQTRDLLVSSNTSRREIASSRNASCPSCRSSNGNRRYTVMQRTRQDRVLTAVAPMRARGMTLSQSRNSHSNRARHEFSPLLQPAGIRGGACDKLTVMLSHAPSEEIGKRLPNTDAGNFC